MPLLQFGSIGARLSRPILSIRFALLSLVVLAVLPVGMFAGAVVHRLAEGSREILEAQIDQRARVAAIVVEERLWVAVAGLTALAASNFAQAGDFASLYAQAQAYLASQDFGQAVLLIDRNGQQLLNTRRPLGAVLPVTGDLDTVGRVFATGRPQASDVFRGAIGRPATVAVDIPVWKDGAVAFDLRLGVPPASLKAALERQQLPAGWIAILFDRDGTIITRSQDEERYAGVPVASSVRDAVAKAGAGQKTFVATVHEGFPIRATVTTVGLSEWRLVVGVPVRWLAERGEQSLLSLAIGGVLALLLGLVLSWGVAWGLAAYTGDLATAAGAVGGGQVPALRPTPIRELNAIADAIRTAHGLLATRDRRRDAAKSEAEAANQAKSRFLAAVGHDLRQPVQSLFLYVAVLSATRLDDRQRQAAAGMNKALQALKEVLDSLVDVARLDARVVLPSIQNFPVANVTGVVDAALRPLAQAKGLEFHMGIEPVVVRSDPAMLGRVLRNLVENAIKYTNQGGITVRSRCSAGMAIIEVIDTGIGIPADQLEAIFDEFYQLADQRNDGETGLGLGLAIVKRLAHLLGHQIEVHSTPGKGTTFSVFVPLAA